MYATFLGCLHPSIAGLMSDWLLISCDWIADEVEIVVMVASRL
jgi:hypothetical protein